MTTGSTSYMPERFVEGRLWKSVPLFEKRLFSASIERIVLLYIRSV